MKKYVIFSILFWLLGTTHGWCVSSKRALVIGNNNYQDASLRNPVNDANDIGERLEKSGFSVIKKTNVTYQEMEQAIRTFSDQLQEDGIALFYFSGHGVQVDGINYLLPVDTQVYSEDEIKYKAVAAQMVLDKLERVGTRLNIIILDACRNNPFKGIRSLPQGLAEMSSPAGTLIAYATAPGKVAFDGNERNSPYTKYLLKFMQAPNLDVEKMFKQVRIAVMADTNNKQVPWEASSLTGDLYFNPQNSSSTDNVDEVSLFNKTLIKSIIASSTLQPQTDAQGNTYNYNPDNIIDGNHNTAWIEGVSGNGEHEWLQVVFKKKILINLIAIDGEYKGQKNNRVKKIRISFSDGVSKHCVLEDIPKSQQFFLEEPQATQWIRFEILEVYEGERFADTPISEVSFQ